MTAASGIDFEHFDSKTSMDYVYAALVHIPVGAPDNGGDNVLYLGLEKQAAGNGGDNAFGFWLFKNKNVGCSGSGSFTGAHTDGDLFIDGTFTNGGGASDVMEHSRPPSRTNDRADAGGDRRRRSWTRAGKRKALPA